MDYESVIELMVNLSIGDNDPWSDEMNEAIAFLRAKQKEENEINKIVDEIGQSEIDNMALHSMMIGRQSD